MERKNMFKLAAESLDLIEKMGLVKEGSPTRDDEVEVGPADVLFAALVYYGKECKDEEGFDFIEGVKDILNEAYSEVYPGRPPQPLS